MSDIVYLLAHYKATRQQDTVSTIPARLLSITALTDARLHIRSSISSSAGKQASPSPAPQQQ